LRVFEENKIPVSCLAGSSIGSILAAAYASGIPLHRIVAKCREIRLRDIARWHVSRFGLASNDRLGALVQKFFDSKQFEDLKIPTVIVATDLGTGDPVVFRQGPLAEAIRASCAFPGLFEPVTIGTRCLADGGLVAPVPTRAARELQPELVVGVSVGLHDGHRGAPTNIFQVVSRAVSAAQKHQLEGWERHADLVLRPDVQDLAWDDFERIDEAMEAGAASARSAVPQLKKLLARHAEVASEFGKQGELLLVGSLQ
jgi:NTE family protein